NGYSGHNTCTDQFPFIRLGRKFLFIGQIPYCCRRDYRGNLYAGRPSKNNRQKTIEEMRRYFECRKMFLPMIEGLINSSNSFIFTAFAKVRPQKIDSCDAKGGQHDEQGFGMDLRNMQDEVFHVFCYRLCWRKQGRADDTHKD